MNSATPLSISRYYPKGTTYFYQFPSGKDSGFFNPYVLAWQEILGAARMLVYAGDAVKVVTFAQSADTESRYLLETLMGTKLSHVKNMVVLPKKIDDKVFGQRRDNLIKKSLKSLIKKKSLIMSQPYIDDEIEKLYQFPSKITFRLNDKLSLPDFVPKEHLPKKYKNFKNGRDFHAENFKIPFPCVVKISSSCAGDGVRICRNVSDFSRAKNDFSKAVHSVIVEEFIEEKLNIGVQFGIPYDKKKSIDIIGFNQQFIDNDGNYLGGIINPKKKIPVLSKIYKTLKEDILPKARKFGWYGIGGMDVLIDRKNNFYFIDPNFRATAVFPYICIAHNEGITKSMITLTGFYKKSKSEFMKNVLPLARPGSKQLLKVIVLIKTSTGFRFNAGVFFKSTKELAKNADRLLSLGVKSSVLERIVSSFKAGKLSGLV
ncbi:MAG: ATP-grasp domain-containing protein [Candidatus Gracilibacteria bacterium]|jgi:hypothetical protein